MKNAVAGMTAAALAGGLLVAGVVPKLPVVYVSLTSPGEVERGHGWDLIVDSRREHEDCECVGCQRGKRGLCRARARECEPFVATDTTSAPIGCR